MQMLLRCLNALSRTAALFPKVAAFGICSNLITGVDPANANQQSPEAQCDRYATLKLGVAVTAPGVSFEQLDPKMVIPACEAAVQRDPTNGRLLYQLGRGYEKAGKFTEALDRYGRAAAVSYAPAYGAIGNMYSVGRGVEKDERRAFEWFRNGAEADDPASQFTLGQIYENGRGVPQDYSEALRWFHKAADQGLAEGQDSVGYFYSAGLGVAKDDAEAVIWMRKAAEQGMAIAENNLAAMYVSGRGATKDPAEALMWYQRAGRHGYEKAEQSAAMLLQEARGANERTSTAAQPSAAGTSSAGRRVLARGAGVVPGAIICPDMQTWRFVFRQYGEHWTEDYQDTLTRGESKLLRGDAVPGPDLEAYGCALVSAGSPMILENNEIVPIVSAVLPHGTSIRGVTIPAMLGTGNTPSLLRSRR
jgi:TPR repeat protein